MASTTSARADRLCDDFIDKRPVIKELAIFLDTHLDGGGESFQSNIPRGVCVPTLIHFAPAYGAQPPRMYAAAPTPVGSMKEWILFDDSQRFLTVDFFNDWILGEVMATGHAPLDSLGRTRTSHFRDARRRIHQVKTLRQVIVDRQLHLKPPKKGK